MAYMDKAKSVEWETPADFYDSCNQEFDFNLDAAATPQNAKCSRYFTEQDSGLVNSWEGCRVWCNPPYSNLAEWIRKADAEKERAELIVMLIPARTDTRAFHECIYHQAEIRFIKGRLKFGGNQHPAPFASMLVIWRKGGAQHG